MPKPTRIHEVRSARPQKKAECVLCHHKAIVGNMHIDMMSVLTKCVVFGVPYKYWDHTVCIKCYNPDTMQIPWEVAVSNKLIDIYRYEARLPDKAWLTPHPNSKREKLYERIKRTLHP